LEKRIGEDGYSPDAAIGEIKAKGLKFQVTLCTKTVYNMIDRGDFLNITNKDFPVKRDGKKRKYRKTRKVALNNLKGRSIKERPAAIESREESGLCLNSRLIPLPLPPQPPSPRTQPSL
jgi:IS30 family transposase